MYMSTSITEDRINIMLYLYYKVMHSKLLILSYGYVIIFIIILIIEYSYYFYIIVKII